MKVLKFIVIIGFLFSCDFSGPSVQSDRKIASIRKVCDLGHLLGRSSFIVNYPAKEWHNKNNRLRKELMERYAPLLAYTFKKFRLPKLSLAQKTLNEEIINDTLFILPFNDGEALASIMLLNEVQAPYVHVSLQGWGATLDKESLPQEVLGQVKRVAVFEIPGLKEEEALREMGLEVVILDHHNYEGIPRQKDISSIEQLANYIGYEVNKVQRAIGSNDQDYIPGMKAMGLTPEEIEGIRVFDLASQGNSIPSIERGLKLAEEEIGKLNSLNDVVLIENSKASTRYIYQVLGIKSPDGSFNAFEIEKSGKLGFSGNKDFIKKLMEIDFEAFGYDRSRINLYTAGGGSLWGFKPNQRPKGGNSAISDELLAEITKMIKNFDFNGGEAVVNKSIAVPEGSSPDELKKVNMLPRGSALLTSSGDLEKSGIKHIVHAATGAMTKSGGIYEPTMESIGDSIINSIKLAKDHGHKRLAIPFIGGAIFLQRIGVSAHELATQIIKTAVDHRDGLEIRFVAFGDNDTNLFKDVLKEQYPAMSAQDVEVLSGSLTDANLHGATAIVNAANMEVLFGGGLSGVIGKATGKSHEIDNEARNQIEAFYR